MSWCPGEQKPAALTDEEFAAIMLVTRGT